MRSPTSSPCTITFVPVAQQLVQLAVERLQPGLELVAVERTVARRHAQLFIVVEVVRRRDDRHDAPEPVLADPDDLLLPADAPMVLPVAAGPLADRQLVLEDPREVAGRDAERPSTTQAGRHQLRPLPGVAPIPSDEVISASVTMRSRWRCRSTRRPPASSHALRSPLATANTRLTLAASGG